MTRNLSAAALFSVAAALAPAAHAQYTGVSRPSDAPIVTSPAVAGPDTTAQPALIERTPPARVFTAAPSQTSAPLRMHTEPDGTVVSDSPAPRSSAFINNSPDANPDIDPATRARKLRNEADGMVVGDPGNNPGSTSYEGLPGSSIASRRTSGQTLTERDDSAALRAESSEYAGESTRPDVDAQVVTRIDGPLNQLPVGTILRARLQEHLSTTETMPGKEFHAELTEPVERDGRVLLPIGAVLTGRVTGVHGGKRISGSASLHLQPMSITMPDGLKYRIEAQVIDTDLYHSTKVDDEGTILRKDHVGETLAVMGLATGSGAAAGGLMAGPAGALIGAGVGAGVGTALWLKQDRQTDVPAGTRIAFALNQPIFIGNQ
jgi:hypothetical protein